MLRNVLALTLLLCPTASAQLSPLPPKHTGLYYISGSNSNNVGEYAPDGTLLRTFTDPDLTGPRGIAVDDHGNVVVNCAVSDKILVFDLEGTLIQSVSQQGLTGGTGIARSADGRWYVGNFVPGGVFVFDADWNYMETITAPNMDGVNCVAFDDDGTFAVTDAFNGLVHRFSASHQYIGQVNFSGLSSPMSIAKDSTGAHYVSNGSGGNISKFDASWNFLMNFGQGVLSAPQGIVVDENDELTITNFSASTVHRYATDGTLLSSYPLAGITTGRNICWQSSSYALARQGGVKDASGMPVRTLSANGQTGDSLGRMSLSASTPLQVDMQTPPAGSGTGPALLVLFGRMGEPTVEDVNELPSGMGLSSFATPFNGGSPLTLVNSIGHTSLLGVGMFPSANAPATLLSFPNGAGRSMTLTLQGIVRDAGSAGGGYSATNTLVLDVQ